MEIIRKTEKIKHLKNKREQLKTVCEKFPFRANSYYLSLIFWDDPNDPIRRIIIPSEEELEGNGKLDASDEKRYTVIQGCEHKYRDTALLLVSSVCGGFCRFCFRKRIFMGDNHEVNNRIEKGLEYINNHTEITNVLLTGGDPFMLSTEKLAGIIQRIEKIEHVKIIRIGTKMPAFFPDRILKDTGLIGALALAKKQIYVVTHFNHPREITEKAINAVKVLQMSKVAVVNQTPLLNGINSDPEVLSELMNTLSYHGIMPYYVFINRPVKGNKMFSVPVEEAYEIFNETKWSCSGLAKKAKLIMSHSTGKIQVVGLDSEFTYFKYHRHPDTTKMGKLFKRKRNESAYWFDDYKNKE